MISAETFKHITLTVLLSVTCFYVANAQTDTVRFSRTYQYIPNQNTGCAVIPVQDGFLTCGVALDTTLVRQYVIAKLDKAGNVINQNYFKVGLNDNFGKYNAIQFSDNRFFYSGLGGTWVNGGATAILICFDANADTLFTKEYNWSESDGIYCMAKTDSGTIILSGVTSPNGNRQVLFAEIDSLGNVLNYKALGGAETDYGLSLKKTDNNNFVIGGYTNSQDSNYNFLLLKIDSNGNLIFEKKWGTAYSDYIGNINYSRNKTYVNGAFNQIPNVTSKLAYLATISDSGELIDYFSYLNPSIPNQADTTTFFEESIVDEDGFFYTNTDVNYTNDSSNLRQLIWKIDTAGNVVWQRKLETELNYWANRNFWSMQRTRDKGFALYGVAFNSPQVAWLVKLDSLGCLVAGCDTIGIGIKEITLTHGENLLLQSWPNPTNGQFFCSWPQDQNQPTGYRLMNLTGQLVAENSIPYGQNHLELNLSNEPSGVYFLSLCDANRILITKKIVKE